MGKIIKKNISYKELMFDFSLAFTRFFYKQHFYKQRQTEMAKNQGNAWFFGRHHLIHCRRKEGGFHDFAPRNAVTHGISHHFLFNRCMAIDRLGNVLLVGFLLSSSPTSSLCWYIKTILLYEIILVSPDGMSKKGKFSFRDPLH